MALKSNVDFDDMDPEDDMDGEELAVLIKKLRKINRNERRFN